MPCTAFYRIRIENQQVLKYMPGSFADLNQVQQAHLTSQCLDRWCYSHTFKAQRIWYTSSVKRATEEGVKNWYPPFTLIQQILLNWLYCPLFLPCPTLLPSPVLLYYLFSQPEKELSSPWHSFLHWRHRWLQMPMLKNQGGKTERVLAWKGKGL